MTFELFFCSYDLMLKDNWLMIVELSERPKISGNDNQNSHRQIPSFWCLVSKLGRRLL